VSTERPVESAAQTESDLRKRIKHLEEALADIAQRKESLKTGYSDTFDQAGVGIAHVSPTGAFLDVNAHFCDMLGMSREQLGATTFQAITYEPDLDKNLEALAALLRGEIPGYRMEKRYLRANGELIWVDLTVSAHRGSDGEPIKLISIISDITEKKAAEERQEFLLGELNHRTKNLIAVVQAIVNQTAANAESVADLKAKITRRLVSMTASQDAMVAKDGRQAMVRDLVEAQLAIVLAADDPRIVATGPDLSLDANATRVIGMALHELCTNACKYGALSLLSGEVHISWAVEPERAGRFTMTWVERGGPKVTPPGRVGFGRRVVELMVMNSTNGTVKLVFNPEGVEWHFSAPLSAILA
jgi:PAS domain S-box-containing protein